MFSVMFLAYCSPWALMFGSWASSYWFTIGPLSVFCWSSLSDDSEFIMSCDDRLPSLAGRTNGWSFWPLAWPETVPPSFSTYYFAFWPSYDPVDARSSCALEVDLGVSDPEPNSAFSYSTSFRLATSATPGFSPSWLIVREVVKLFIL